MVGNKELLCGAGPRIGKIEKPAITECNWSGWGCATNYLSATPFKSDDPESKLTDYDIAVGMDKDIKNATIITPDSDFDVFSNESGFSLSGYCTDLYVGDSRASYIFVRYHGEFDAVSEWSDAFPIKWQNCGLWEPCD